MLPGCVAFSPGRTRMWPSAWTPYCIDDVRRGRKLTGSAAAGPNGRNGGCLGPEWEAGWSHITSYIQYWSRNRRTRHSPGKERSVTEIWVAGRCYPLRAVGVGVSSDVHDTGSDRRGTVRISGPSLDGTVNLDAEHIPPRKVQDPGSDTSTGAPQGQRHCRVGARLSRPVLGISGIFKSTGGPFIWNPSSKSNSPTFSRH